MKKKLLIFAATLQLFCGIPFIQSQQETNIPAFPEGEEISEEEFAKLVEKMVQEIEKEIKQEEEIQKTKSEVKKTPQTKPSSTPTISTNKKNNLRQSWVPTKEEEALPPLKKEILDFYLSKLMDNLSLIQENLAGLSSYEREKFAPYKVDIDKTISYLGQIKGEEIYLTSLYNDKFKDLRESLLRLSEELEKINRDIRVKTGEEEETTVEELYEAERKEKIEKFEDSIEEKTIKQPSIPKTTAFPEKKEVALSKIADPKIKKLSTLSWYQKLLNWIFNFLKEGWNSIISLFVSKKKDLQPIKKEFPQTSPTKEKPQPKATEKESPDEFLELMEVMQEGLKEIKKDKSPGKAKPSYHAMAKMAWKKFLKLLQQGEFKKLNDQFKAVIDFSAKAIEEERKKEEEKVKKAEEDKRRREEREGRPTPSTTYPSTPYYPYYEPYQPYQAPTHGTYHPGSASRGYAPEAATSPTQQAHPSKKFAKPSEPSETTTAEATKFPGGSFAPGTAKTPIMREKKLKSEIIELIKNLEINYKDKLVQATLQPRPYPQTVPQLVEAVEKGLGEIKKKQEKLAKVISKFTNENLKKNEEWKKQDEEYNETLKKLTPIKKDLQELKR